MYNLNFVPGYNVIRKFFPYIAIVVTFYSIFGGIQKSKFGFVDDHEIVTFNESISVKTDQFSNFFNSIYRKTEVGQFGKYPRFRPSYYFLRFSEIQFFKLNAAKYYKFRIFIGIIFFCYIFYFLNRFFYTIPLLFGIFFLLSDFYWTDIFFRIGPAEFYCLVGLLLLLMAFDLRFNANTKMALYVLAMLILLGSKENFFPFLIFGLYLLFDDFYHSKVIRPLLIAMFSLPCIYAMIIVWSLLLNFSNAPVDIYGNSVTFLDRFNKFLEIFFHAEFWILLLISSYVEFTGSNKFNIKLRLFFHFALLNFIFNFIFYNGNWPDMNRYNIPGFFLYKFATMLFILKSLSCRTDEFNSKMIIVTSITLILPFQGGTFRNISEKMNSDLFAREKIYFNLNYLKQVYNTESDAVIILPSHPFDHELTWSFVTQMHNLVPALFFYVEPVIPEQKNVILFEGLTNDLYSKSENGDVTWHILPKRNQKKSYEKCFIVTFHSLGSLEKRSNCKSSILINFE